MLVSDHHDPLNQPQPMKVDKMANIKYKTPRLPQANDENVSLDVSKLGVDSIDFAT